MPVITAPLAGDLFRVGQSVTLVGSATDAEEGALPDGALTWNVLLHHNAHTHPFLTDAVGNNVAFVTPPPEDLDACLTSYLEIRLTATDGAGAQTTVVQNFDPRKVAVNLETSPSGLTLEVNGSPFVAAATITSWDNYSLQVNAPDQSSGAIPYTFIAWSDGGAQAHTFTTPAAATTLGAAFSAPAPVPQAVPFLAVTSGHQANHVEWLNPSGPTFGSTVLVFRTGRFPTTPTDGTTLFTGGVAGDKSAFDHGSLSNGVTYYYAAFVNLALGGTSAGRFARGRPFDNTVGAVKWAYSTGATSLAPPGLGASVLAVSNDRVVHALSRGAAGGTWPSSFAPLLLGGVVQTRPPLVSGGLVAGHSSLAFLGAQDGIVYAVDAESGARVWQSTTLGEGVQAAPAGLFVSFGAAFDRLLVGTRNTTGANRFYGLDAKTGFTVGVPYEGGDGGGLGIVSGGASVDYATSRVYFASRAAAAGASTVWCLEVTTTGFVYRWSQPIGDVDGSPVVRGDRVYVGGNDGVVHAFDKLTGTEAWSFSTGAQPFKGFLFPDRSGLDLYVATTNRVFGLTDDGTSASLKWPAIAVASPSIVLFRAAEGAAPARLYFGGGDQRLARARPFAVATHGEDGRARGHPRGDRCPDPGHGERSRVRGFRRGHRLRGRGASALEALSIRSGSCTRGRAPREEDHASSVSSRSGTARRRASTIPTAAADTEAGPTAWPSASRASRAGCSTRTLRCAGARPPRSAPSSSGGRSPCSRIWPRSWPEPTTSCGRASILWPWPATWRRCRRLSSRPAPPSSASPCPIWAR